MVAASIEDDVALLWLTNPSLAPAAVQMLQDNLAQIGGGEIFSGNSLSLIFGVDSTSDSRVPDVVLAPNVGTVYTGKMKKLSEHGGFAVDDTNVMMVVSGPGIGPAPMTMPVTTQQVAPTILKALGLDPNALQGVQKEGTAVLPGLPFSR